MTDQSLDKISKLAYAWPCILVISQYTNYKTTAKIKLLLLFTMHASTFTSQLSLDHAFEVENIVSDHGLDLSTVAWNSLQLVNFQQVLLVNFSI